MVAAPVASPAFESPPSPVASPFAAPASPAAASPFAAPAAASSSGAARSLAVLRREADALAMGYDVGAARDALARAPDESTFLARAGDLAATAEALADVGPPEEVRRQASDDVRAGMELVLGVMQRADPLRGVVLYGAFGRLSAVAGRLES